MATAQRDEIRQRQPARWGRNLLALAVLAIVVAAGFSWSRMREDARARAAYAAQADCLCRFGSGRGADSCAADPGVTRRWVRLGVDDAAHAVTASVPTLASQTARWSPENGCMLDPW